MILTTKQFFRNFFKGWNLLEYILLALALTVPTIIGLIFNCAILEVISSTLAGIVGVLFAKAKIEGYFLAILSSALYAFIALQSKAYGEFIIALVISYPILFYGIGSWARNKRNDTEKGRVVQISHIGKREFLFIALIQSFIIAGCYFLLKTLDTNQLVVSTISLSANIFAGYLLARRSRFNFIAYMAHDIASITLWSLLAADGISSAAMIVTPAMFLLTDIYGTFAWLRLKNKQIKVSQSSHQDM